MPPITIPIYFDYASTLCYVAWRIVSELEPELGFEALWKGVPIALRDHRARAGRALGELERQKVLMVSAETGVSVAPPARWIDSSAALEGAEVARDAGVFRQYHDAIFHLAFEKGVDIADLQVLESIARNSGLDPAWFRAALQTHQMAPRIEEYRREADEFSALGYPTFILGDYPLIGIQPIATMRQVITRFIRQRQTEPQA